MRLYIISCLRAQRYHQLLGKRDHEARPGDCGEDRCGILRAIRPDPGPPAFIIFSVCPDDSIEGEIQGNVDRSPLSTLTDLSVTLSVRLSMPDNDLSDPAGGLVK